MTFVDLFVFWGLLVCCWLELFVYDIWLHAGRVCFAIRYLIYCYDFTIFTVLLGLRCAVGYLLLQGCLFCWFVCLCVDLVDYGCVLIVTWLPSFIIVVCLYMYLVYCVTISLVCVICLLNV